MTTEEGSLRQGAEQILRDLEHAHPQDSVELVLRALCLVKLVAYEEMLIAARFHAGIHGKGIEGMVDGIQRAIDSQRGEL